MKVSKNVLSMMAVTLLVATLAMPFAAEAKKHHGKKASHSKSHKKAKKNTEAAPAPEATAPAAGGDVAH